ncbi:MAG: hypothetical protein IJM57_08250 [Lachnospiraceae bacterium]|nr:hypothetical protein [Lachnospiraceae bacterium]
MELLFIILSLVCQIILLSHASDHDLGGRAVLALGGVTFTGRGLMILSVIFLALAAFFCVVRLSNAFAEKEEVQKIKAENDVMKAERQKQENAANNSDQSNR